MKKLILIVLAASMLYGCSTKASRKADCLAEGVSADTCYLAESQRQAAILDASQKQAYENSNQAVKELTSKHHAKQHAQAAHKAHVWHLDGVTVKRDKYGSVLINDKPALTIEQTEQATAYRQGVYEVVLYKSGKAGLIKSGVVVGWMK